MNIAEEVVARLTQTSRIECPECGHNRKKKNQKTMSVTVYPDRNVYDCHHCGLSGKVTHENPALKHFVPKPKVTPIPTQLNQDKSLVKKFFAARGVTISDKLTLPQITTDEKYFGDHGLLPAVGFVYGPKEAPEAIKWRAVAKKAFTQTGAAREFYGMELLDKDTETLVIVEGEPDVIALASLGIKAVSVPNGAPIKISHGRSCPEEDKKYGYLWEAKDFLEGMSKVILAVDQDEPGEALAEELARRIGRAKCWRTTYPDGCKDLTDVLAEHGPEAVQDALDMSEPMPLVGVYPATDYKAELLEFYLEGHGKGESTSIEGIDELFTVKEGQLSIVTGLPSSGKSEFVDQIMVNLAVNKSWKFAVASFENPPSVHIAKLAEKIVGKPFYKGLTPRMNRTELEEAVDFINEHFVFLESRDGNMATMESIFERTKAAVMRLGVRGLVIDPYNYIQQPNDPDGEHKTISNMLSSLTAFIRAHDIHCWFVAHPQKIYPRDDGTYPIPKGMHISGSAAWFAKADVGFTVHRSEAGVEIHCWKVRFKWIGAQGIAPLGYDVPTGRYLTPQPIEWGRTDKLKDTPDTVNDWNELDF